tara:strand:- start:1280 stop:1759 length:480 start_codon:yes stop_codon:yes gene_type:complete
MKNLKNKLKNEIYQWKIYDRNEKLIPFTDDMIPENAVGFIYIINMLKDDKRYGYIGKKNFYSKRKKRFGKKALALITDKRSKKYEIVTKLDYQNYFSSNKELKEAYENGVYMNRTIIKICFSKTELTYQETKAQFQHEVLERDNWLNGNILGRFYKGKI